MILGLRRAAAANEERAGRRWLPIDYTAPSELDVASLRGVDVIVNAVGIFAERAGTSFHAVHVNGPCNLFALAAAAGVRRVLQISALGAATDAPTAYLRSKAQGDACAAAFRARQSSSGPRWCSRLTVPAARCSCGWPRCAGYRFPKRPRRATLARWTISVDGLAALVVQPDPPRQIDAVGPAPLGFGDVPANPRAEPGAGAAYLPAACRRNQGAGRRHGARPRQPAQPRCLDHAGAGNQADAGPWQRLLGHTARSPQQFIAPAQTGAVRREALLANLLPLLRLSVSATWLVTAWVSAFVYPRAASLALRASGHILPRASHPWRSMAPPRSMQYWAWRCGCRAGVPASTGCSWR